MQKSSPGRGTFECFMYKRISSLIRAWAREHQFGVPNAHALPSRPCDDQNKALLKQTPIRRPIRSWLQSLSFSFRQDKQSGHEKRYPEYGQANSQPKGEVNKQLTRQRYGKDSFRNIGQVLRCKFSSSSISDSTFHFSIASPRCAVKNGAVSPASIPLEGKAASLFIFR